MNKSIMVGCDLHDKNIVAKIAVDRGKMEKRTYNNTQGGRATMIKELKKRVEELDNARVIFAYEASYMGFGFYDELTDAGFEGYILAPTRIERSYKHRRNKTDDRDAERILEIVRGHILAGNPMPSIWIPDLQTRNDRELVRMRLSVGDKVTATKIQINSLLKRNKLKKPNKIVKNWTKRHREWLGKLPESAPDVSEGARLALRSLLRQLLMLEREIVYLDKDIALLAKTSRYAEPDRELQKLKGVGLLTSMVYLAEMGDLSRFGNRRKVGSFLGLVPSSAESGEKNDRKGHITHQGPGRVTRVLCQASWFRARYDPGEKEVYDCIVRKNPKHKKIAVVALMRRLGIKMWHRGLEAQQRAGCFDKPVCHVVT